MQSELGDRWGHLGLEVEHRPYDWTRDDYNEDLAETGELLQKRHENGERSSIVAISASVKKGVSLLLRYPHYIHRLVAIAGKESPYIFEDEETPRKFQSLAQSSSTLEQDLRDTDPDVRIELAPRILWITSVLDEEIVDDIPPEKSALPGMQRLEVPGQSHLEGIELALTDYAQEITGFIRTDDASV